MAGSVFELRRMTRRRFKSQHESKRRYQNYADQVDRQHFQHCANDTEVLVFKVNDAGHTSPMRDHPRGRTEGHVNRDIDATAIIVEWMMTRQE